MTHDVVSTAGHLVSMVIAYKSTESIPLALLAGHVKTVLLQMHAGEPSSGINESEIFFKEIMKIKTMLKKYKK
jgi:hypothetical protein